MDFVSSLESPLLKASLPPLQVLSPPAAPSSAVLGCIWHHSAFTPPPQLAGNLRQVLQSHQVLLQTAPQPCFREGRQQKQTMLNSRV